MSGAGGPTSSGERDLGKPGDPELVRRMQGGDETALELLYGRYGGLVFTLALRIVGDPELAREVLQDTFLKSWSGSESYDARRGRVPWWLMGIARNRAIDLLRSRSHQARMREQERLSPQAPETSERGLDVLGVRREMVEALQTLTAVQRQAIELAYYGGLTQAEIARQLGEPLGTIKSRTRDAMDRLRTLLASIIEPKREA
jgi:RNA polymerase sigma-70 factor, ECF subfamily